MIPSWILERPSAVRALARSPSRPRSGGSRRAWRGSSSGVRTGGDGALLRYARKFDGLALPLEVTPAEIEARGASRRAGRPRAIRVAARHIRRVARRQVPRGWTVSPVAGVRDRAARHAARPGRLLRARRPLSAALVAADDGHSGARRRCPRGGRGLPEAGPGGAAARRSRRASTRLFGSAARTRSPRSPTAPRRSRGWTRSSGRATRTWPRPRRWWPATARSTSSPARARSRSCRRTAARSGSPPT